MIPPLASYNNMTTTSSSSSSSLTVYLLCSGNGADAASYRPRRDESQWWNRRDALVRCVASFLLGPEAPEDRELILLCDGDHCRVHMKFECESGRNGMEVVPTEFAVIALWKEALTKAPSVVHRGRLSCWAVVSASVNNSNNNSQSNNKPGSIQDWGKRQLLKYLQKNCPMEFLREHHLNSSSAVLLRKVNRSGLAKVYQIWHKKNPPTCHKTASSSLTENSAENSSPSFKK